MIQRDIIQRMIHQIAAVLARMIGKKAEEQLIILDDYLEKHNGLSGDKLDEVIDDHLLDYLSDKINLNPYQIESVAAVLNARGDIFMNTQEIEKAKIDFKRAILLLDYVDVETAVFSFDRIELIASIKDKLEQIV